MRNCFPRYCPSEYNYVATCPWYTVVGSLKITLILLLKHVIREVCGHFFFSSLYLAALDRLGQVQQGVWGWAAVQDEGEGAGAVWGRAVRRRE